MKKLSFILSLLLMVSFAFAASPPDYSMHKNDIVKNDLIQASCQFCEVVTVIAVVPVQPEYTVTSNATSLSLYDAGNSFEGIMQSDSKTIKTKSITAASSGIPRRVSVATIIYNELTATADNIRDNYQPYDHGLQG